MLNAALRTLPYILRKLFQHYTHHTFILNKLSDYKRKAQPLSLVVTTFDSITKLNNDIRHFDAFDVKSEEEVEEEEGEEKSKNQMLHTFDWTDKNDAKILCIIERYA